MQIVLTNQSCEVKVNIPMKKFKIAIFHYHFLPGGVTTVAVHAVNALLQYSAGKPFALDEIVFVSGRKDNLARIISGQIRIPHGMKVSIRSEVSAQLDYLAEDYGNTLQQLEKGILEVFRKYEGFIWWVHNYNLGKNPVFTRLLTGYLESESSQKALLQIHDFPECARPDNYRFLTGESFTLYPLRKNLRYIAINSRDERYLKEAGIPADLVYLLYDPVPDLKKQGILNTPGVKPDQGTTALLPSVFKKALEGKSEEKPETESSRKKEAKKMLAECFGRFFPGFNSGIP